MVTGGTSSHPRPRLLPVPNVRLAAPLLVPVPGGGIRIVRPTTPRSAATTLAMPVPRLRVPSSQVRMGSPNMRRSGPIQMPNLTPAPRIATSEGSGEASVIVRNQTTHIPQAWLR